jgi:hypothetical protein
MIIEPTCFQRNCKHFLGVKNDGEETTERVYCKAFPDRIPDGIAYGNNPHSKPLSFQDNNIVYERAE